MTTDESTAAPSSEWTPAAGRRGPFREGDVVQLTDPKGRHSTITLTSGKAFHSHKGSFEHDELIGAPEGTVVKTNGGQDFLTLRPLLSDFVLSMPRGATVVYPKDSAQIVGLADIHPGARVVEAGAGSGALSCSLLRAIGPTGALISFERRPEFAAVARSNVDRFFGGVPATWDLVVGDLVEELGKAAPSGSIDRVVLDMLAPWECIEAVADALIPGGVLCCYVATTTQMSKVVEAMRTSEFFTEPRSWETLLRTWHVEGLSVRPDHRMIGHTGFLVTARRMAPGVTPPLRRRRPAKGAYPELETAEEPGGEPGERRRPKLP
ncbi:MAG: tRNA (adenine-N1)-methyltransferase [Sporichthyaceae bacterium]